MTKYNRIRCQWIASATHMRPVQGRRIRKFPFGYGLYDPPELFIGNVWVIP